MKLKQVKVKEINGLIVEYGLKFSKKDSAQILESEDGLKMIRINSKNLFFYHREKVVPTLHLMQSENDLLKKITVDMGAIKFVINGADIMRPGIVQIDDGIDVGSYVVVVDEKNSKPIAIGIAKMDTAGLRDAKSGKVIENVHFVGDEIWKID
jgi:PUA domain protein